MPSKHQKRFAPWLFFLAALLLAPGASSARLYRDVQWPTSHGKCVQIFYDKVPDQEGPYWFGRVHALFLQNLLGHFPSIEQFIVPIELYQRGAIDRCDANIYLGTYYQNPGLPQDFIDDYLQTEKTVVWAGYNIWQLGDDALSKLWGVKFRGLSTLDHEHRDAQGYPTFFRMFSYKGEQFEKYGQWDHGGTGKFVASWEISLFDFDQESIAPQVISWAKHNGTGEEVPYVLRRGNRWYIGDSPFSFITESDRYLIFADLLFDILNEPPRRTSGPKPALLRLEDVHPMVAQWQLRAMSDMLERKNVKYAVSLIPVFSDPFMTSVRSPADRFVALGSRPQFLEWLNRVKANGASFVYHGFTHQLGSYVNPNSGMTGDDFEFWDRVRNEPVATDSAAWALGRIEDGLALLERAGVKPSAWLTPHYQASALDYVVFGQAFRWNVGRHIYVPAVVQQSHKLPDELTVDVGGAAANGKRVKYFDDLIVKKAEGLLPNGQFYPYEIYGDVYGLRIVPENIGNIQPYVTEQVFNSRSVDEMIAALKRNRVLRDTWASFFVHPFLVAPLAHGAIGKFPGDTHAIERLIDAVREYGYEFVSLDEWTQAQSLVLRPEPIEISAY